MCGLKIEMANRCEWLTPAVQIILNAPDDQRAAEPMLALPKIRRGQPMGANDAVIKGLGDLMIIYGAAEGKTH